VTTDNRQENAALYALDAMTPSERAEFLKQIGEDKELAELVVEMRDAAALVAYSATSAEPRPGMKSELMRALSNDTSSNQNANNPSRPPVQEAKPSAQNWIPWTLAAGFAIFAGVLWGTGKNSQTLTGEISRQRTLIEEMFGRIVELEKSLAGKNAIIAASAQPRDHLPQVQLATLSSATNPAHLGSVMWDASAQRGFLHVCGLPATPAGHDYQLWMIEPGQASAVSAGVFKVGVDSPLTVEFAPVRAVSEVAKFTVTLEKSGGAPTPEGHLIIAN
jgi:anti-sigma-K factor RskA